MKRILYSLVGLFLFASIASAQQNAYPVHVKDFKKNYSENDQVFRYNNGAQRLSSYDDTIWFDSFDSASVWNIDNQPSGGWQIASNVGTWYFPANAAINSTTGGNYAVMVPDDPNNASSTLHRISTVNPIDISTYSNQNLVLSYEKFGARFYDTLKVEVSNNGVNWTTLDNNTDFPLLSTAGGGVLANPTSRDLFVPVSIVNGSDLYIRFTWDADRSGVEGIGYGYFIDDIALFNVPSNDLSIDKTAFFENVGFSYEWYYGAMPIRQAAADEITFSAVYSNRGSADQTNTKLDVIVSGQDNQTFSSATQGVLLAGEIADDTAKTTTLYGPDNGVGTYTFTWNVVGDNVDDIPSNNMFSVDMDVTENEFSMTPLPVSSANVLGKGGADEPFVITQEYIFNTEDTITSMGIALDQEWTVQGASFQLSVIDENEVPVTQSSIYITDNSMITGDMVYFPLPEAIIPAGFYEARIEVFAESLFLVTSQDPSHLQAAPGGGFYTRTRITYGGNTFIEDQAYLTIRTKTTPNCNPNAEVLGAVFDVSTAEPFDASIEISDVNGLSGTIFTYSWSGPTGFTSGSMNIDELAVKGDYTLVVTDADGCTATGVFTVDGNVSVDELANEAVINVFPNPSNGNFNVSLENASGNYDINITNSLGQVAASRNVTVSGSNQIIEFSDLNLPTGVYTVSVANTENVNTPSIFKVVVE